MASQAAVINRSSAPGLSFIRTRPAVQFKFSRPIESPGGERCFSRPTGRCLWYVPVPEAELPNPRLRPAGC